MSTFAIYQNLYFTTTSVFNKEHLLQNQNNVNHIYDSLNFITNDNRAIIYAFCIMSNHIHLIWEVLEPWSLEKVQHSLLSYTSKNILSNIPEEDRGKFLVNASDRKYQIWKRNPLSIEITRGSVLQQKMDYIHNNPLVANLVDRPEKYLHSSYCSYFEGVVKFSFLTLW